MGMEAEEKVRSKLGLDFEILDSGCCGMAGSFGLERGDRYDVSIKAGERVLLPAMRSVPKDTLIIADGFSCREQIAQTTERHGLHLSQVIRLAMHEGSAAPARDYPEGEYCKQRAREQARSQLRAAAYVGAGAILAGGLLVWARNSRKAG
jgi:hypothetical protein